MSGMRRTPLGRRGENQGGTRDASDVGREHQLGRHLGVHRFVEHHRDAEGRSDIGIGQQRIGDGDAQHARRLSVQKTQRVLRDLDCGRSIPAWCACNHCHGPESRNCRARTGPAACSGEGKPRSAPFPTASGRWPRACTGSSYPIQRTRTWYVPLPVGQVAFGYREVVRVHLPHGRWFRKGRRRAAIASAAADRIQALKLTERSLPHRHSCCQRPESRTGFAAVAVSGN
jgi:hypothetical protein